MHLNGRIRSVSSVSFDGDMTLWDFQKVMRHSLKHVLVVLQQEVGTSRADSLTVEEMIGIRDELASEVKGEFWRLEDIRRVSFERTLAYVGSPNQQLAGRLNDVYMKHRFEDVELYDDVVPNLDAVRSHFGIGLLSNGNTYPEKCGLEGRFAFVVFSQDVGFEKPDPRIFEIAAERALCSVEELMHVGDSLENDVAGANEAGAVSVWLNRDGLANDTGIEADYEVRSLTDIPKLLGMTSDKWGK